MEKLLVCTDRAAAMVRHVKGFMSRMKEKNQDLTVMNCFLHSEVLIAKILPEAVVPVLDNVVRIANFVKT